MVLLLKEKDLLAGKLTKMWPKEFRLPTTMMLRSIATVGPAQGLSQGLPQSELSSDNASILIAMSLWKIGFIQTVLRTLKHVDHHYFLDNKEC